MSDDLVKQSIAELQDLVRCRCHPAYKDRGMHDPDCECDSADAVQVVIDYIAELEEYKALYEGLYKAAVDALAEIRDIARLSEGVEFYAMLAEKAIKELKEEKT